MARIGIYRFYNLSATLMIGKKSVSTTIILVFVILQAVVTLFTLITLPVEFDASRRALIWLKNSNISTEQEINYSEDALKWAASTYVVAALAAAAYLLYYLAILRD